MRPISFRFSKELQLELDLLKIEEESLKFWDEVSLSIARPKEVIEYKRQHRKLELDELFMLLSRATK